MDIVFPGEIPVGSFGVSRLPTNYDLVLWKGDSVKFDLVFTAAGGVPIDLAGLTAEATISNEFSGPTQYPFTCTISDTNKVRIYLPTSVSKTMPPGSYIWNFQIVEPNGDTRTYLAGDVTVYGEVD